MQSENIMACAKHFPGHGNTSTDSHSSLPSIAGSKTELMNLELKPFKAAINADVEMMYWSPDKIEIQVEVPRDQLLVLSEIYYPEGWKITSHPDWEIHPVNTILRGLHIPAGAHQIVMEFIPNDIRYGTFLTWGSTAILILFILAGIISKRKVNESIAETI
jgi:uncharacterized membrane protein YfhO